MKIRGAILISFLIFLTAVALLLWYSQQKKSTQFSQWIREQAIELNHESPFINEASAEKIVQDIKGSRLIALGESTHGTHEFEVIKLELLKLLVEKFNCRVLALEASYSRCLLINQLINRSTSIDSIVQVVGFINLQTIEFSNTIEWIREYNIQHPTDRISIVGIDSKGNEDAVNTIEKFYYPYDVTLTQSLVDCIQEIERAPILSSTSPLNALTKKFLMLTGKLEKKVTSSDSSFSFRQFEEVKGLQKIIHQYAITYTEPTIERVSLKRDSCMAANLLSILDTLHAAKSIVLSAHNGHVSAGNWTNDFTPLGYRLREKLGSSYFAIGFDFINGSFRANDPSIPDSPGWENITAEKPTYRHLGHYFNQADKPDAYLSLDTNELDPAITKWIDHQLIKMNSVGSASIRGLFTDDSVEITLGSSFDAIIMVNMSSPTTSILSYSDRKK